MSRSRSLIALAFVVGSLALVACAPQAPTTGSFVPAGCYDSPDAGSPDFIFSGTVNVANNLNIAWNWTTLTPSENGTCNGTPVGAPYAFTLVRATGEAAAQGKCATLGLNDGVGQLNQSYPGFPADGWVCNPAPADA